MTIAHFGLFDAEGLGLTADAFARSALVVDDVIERTVYIEQHTHQSAFLPIRIFDTAPGFRELRMITRLSCWFRKQQRTAKALSAKAIGMLELEGRMLAQAF